MSEYDLTDIDNVGPARADDIADAGFETVPGVAYTDVDEFATQTGIAEGMAENIVESALELAEEESEDSVDEDETTEEEAEQVAEDIEEVVEDLDESELEEWISFDPTESIGLDEAADGEYLLPVQMETQLLMHVIHVLLEEATKKHQSNSFEARNSAYGVSRKLMALVSDPTGEVDQTVSVTANEIKSLYRGITQGSSDYASRSGIPKMWGDFETFKETIDEKRQEMMAE